MSKILKLALFVFLISLFTPETAAICKWVDQDGVVHYAETCPEEVDATAVKIQPPPTQEKVEETSKRSEKIRKDMQISRDLRIQEREQQTLEKQTYEEKADTVNRECAEARWNLGILGKQLPVYFDDEHVLHFNRSLHDYWYGGPRTYLDEPQRQAEIAHYSAVESKTCTATEADIRARIMDYQERSRKDLCRHLRNKLENMRKQNTGIPSDEMRELANLIENRCN